MQLAYYHLGLALAYLKKNSEAKKALEQSLKYEKSQQYADDTRRIIASLGNGTLPSMSVNSASGAHFDPQLIEKFLKAKQWTQAQGAIEAALKQGGDGDPLLWNSLGLFIDASAWWLFGCEKGFQSGNFSETWQFCRG